MTAAASIPVSRIQRLVVQPARITPASSDPALPVRSLHLNEAPFPPPPGAIAAMQQAAAAVNRYPDHEGEKLVAELARRNAVPAARFVIGAGSNELLTASAALALDPGDEMVAPAPGFPAYAKGAAVNAALHVAVPNRADGVVDVDGILAAVSPRTRLVFVCSPHNPTGGLMTRDEIERLVARLPDDLLLHFDEAYYEFGRYAGGPDVLPILAARPGPWIVTRSFSKAYGLAGARVGYGITGSEELAEAYRKLRTNFSVNAVALAGARAALDDEAYLARMLDHVAEQRNRLATGLAPYGFTALPSAANFLTLLTPRPAAALAAALRADNIYVVALPAPGAHGALRISIGTAEDTHAVIAGLKRALAA